MEIHILESLRFHRFLRNRNFDQFIFIFLKECGRRYYFEDTKRNALISQTFEIKFITKCF